MPVGKSAPSKDRKKRQMLLRPSLLFFKRSRLRAAPTIDMRTDSISFDPELLAMLHQLLEKMESVSAKAITSIKRAEAAAMQADNTVRQAEAMVLQAEIIIRQALELASEQRGNLDAESLMPLSQKAPVSETYDRESLHVIMTEVENHGGQMIVLQGDTSVPRVAPYIVASEIIPAPFSDSQS